MRLSQNHYGILEQMSSLRISAKDLGQLALPNFCARCFWIKRRLSNKLPFQSFPGIFSSIDSYTKKVIHGQHDTTGAFPEYLSSLGDLRSYVNPPHYTKFSRTDEKTGVTLWGTPDAIFMFADESYLIADYKTARITNTQDGMLPQYQVQLNAYAYIGETSNVTPVSKLALLYFEPETEESHAIESGNRMEHGFKMGFGCKIKTVDLNRNQVLDLLESVRFFDTLPSSPLGREGCKDCENLARLLEVASQQVP